jgi:hypothetical protein
MHPRSPSDMTHDETPTCHSSVIGVWLCLKWTPYASWRMTGERRGCLGGSKPV